MKSKLRENKGASAMLALAILAAVLILTSPLVDNGVPVNNDVPDNNVVATVGGEQIMQKDVAEMQERYYGMSEEEALEQLIIWKVIYQEAEREGYMPTMDEAEEQMAAQLAMQGMTLEDFQGHLEEEGRCYDEQLERFQQQLAIEDYLGNAVEVPEVTEDEAREFYDDWKQTFPEEPPPFEELKSEIIMHLEQQKQQEAIGLFIEELMAEADDYIEYM